MPALTWWVQMLQGTLSITALLTIFYGFWQGTLPEWIKRMVGFDDLRESVQSVESKVDHLSSEHQEVRSNLEVLKTGQVDIARAVNDDEEIDVETLERHHFDDETRQGDFLLDGGLPDDTAATRDRWSADGHPPRDPD